MKAIYYKILAGSVILCSVMSCQVKEISSNEQIGEKASFTFYAEGAENETKTIRQEDGNVWWDANESIKIFCNGVSGKFTSDNKEPSATTTFTGSFDSSVTNDDISNYGIMAMYPYQEDATYVGGVLKFTLPSEQVATKGTFSKDLFPCIASSKGTNLSFYNVCSGIKFSVKNDGIRSVTIKTNGDEPIAGTIEVDYFWDNMPSVSVLDGVSEVTVYAPNKGYFEPGEFYYITILPGPAPAYYFWDGFTFIYNKDEVSDSFTITEKVQLPRAKFGVIDGKDEGLLFVDNDQPIEFADAVMKEMCVVAFDTNGDGELSFGEARAVTDLSKMTLSNKTFKSFDEFQYFTSVKTIPSEYFSYCLFQSIILPKGLQTIKSGAFLGCSNMISISIPPGVISFGDWGGEVFRYCTSLTEVVFPNNIKTFFGSNTFEKCSNLTNVILPNNLEEISSYMFSDCYNLKSINIPDKVKTIKSSAFANCSNLISINIPEGMRSILSGAFNGCSNLETIILPTSLTVIGSSAFWKCSSLISVAIPANIKTIDLLTFADCSSLEEVTLPEGVIEIGYSAFNDCTNLTSIVLPRSITKIGDKAFQFCSSLSSVFVKPSIPPILLVDGFEYNAKSRKIFVPIDAVEAYKTAEGWSKYADDIVGYNFDNNDLIQ